VDVLGLFEGCVAISCVILSLISRAALFEKVSTRQLKIKLTVKSQSKLNYFILFKPAVL
jgi:hypothetical protein